VIFLFEEVPEIFSGNITRHEAWQNQNRFSVSIRQIFPNWFGEYGKSPIKHGSTAFGKKPNLGWGIDCWGCGHIFIFLVVTS
ncbi:MAG: hypothetical protein ACI85I_002676, partial [Arenicella sp.]